ncbi:unnamed protein product [Owenia fusiformis]|uniref:Myotubularin phosphatase domain-containing protein n=1 Tax=Owenia fusiformis TaxID=6347 RepID=A0A8S4PXW5_OWEFU|nr:unnamed protein product [Owenia fusiformis]
MSRSFKSYIDVQEPPEKAEASNVMDAKLEPSLLPGEILIGTAHNVLKVSPYSDQKQGSGTYGSLFCTNFKLSFLTADRSSYELMGSKQRNLLLDEYDISLSCVDTVYSVSKKNTKRVKLMVGGIPSSTKTIEVHCKNFRILTFSFKMTTKDETKSVVNALVHHAFPARPDLLFAFDYASPESTKELPYPTVMYDMPSHWEGELKRLHCSDKWRVTLVNSSYSRSCSLPESFVVPSSVTDPDITKGTAYNIKNRVSTWSYSYENGASLVRLARLIPDTANTLYEEKMCKAILETNPGNTQRELITKNLNKRLPTVKDLQSNFEKLKEICMPGSKSDCASKDASWYADLDNTGWLQIIRDCLQISREVAQAMIGGNTVGIQEEESCDYTCIITSLVQLMLDPHYRTISGFQSLIQKEWIAMGHPFLTRCGHITSQDIEKSPVFLIFLDCVWQLTQNFPTSFQFTEIYLTILWDSTYLTIFDTFLFDNPHQRNNLSQDFGGRRIPMVHTWQWGSQLAPGDLPMFNNPIYSLHSENEKTTLNMSESTNCEANHHVVSSSKEMTSQSKDMMSQSRDLILPLAELPLVKFWSYLYLRWLTPVVISGGGSVDEYLRQCTILEEIQQLRSTLDNLQTNSVLRHHKKPHLFTLNHVTSPTKLHDALTSSFPFQTVGSTLNSPSVVGSPVTPNFKSKTPTPKPQGGVVLKPKHNKKK